MGSNSSLAASVDDIDRLARSEYIGDPAMNFDRMRAFRMGRAAGRRNPHAHIRYARDRWKHRHRGTPLILCIRDWEDGWHTGILDGTAL